MDTERSIKSDHKEEDDELKSQSNKEDIDADIKEEEKDKIEEIPKYKKYGVSKSSIITFN